MENLCKEECFAMSPLDGSFAFVVREEKVEEFMNRKPNKEKIAKILERANRAEKI